MKRIASILLLGILLFNWVGFRFVSSFMEQQAEVVLESQLDKNNYDESQLISIKIPAATQLSYYAQAKQFDRVDGKVEVNGVPYQYVKRRLINDSLEYLCIPNQQGIQIRNAKDDFFKLVNDLQHTGQGKKTDSHPGSSKNFSVDCYTVHDLFKVNLVVASVSHDTRSYNENLSVTYFPTAEQPPEHC